LENQKYRRTEAIIGGVEGMLLKYIKGCENFNICQKGKTIGKAHVKVAGRCVVRCRRDNKAETESKENNSVECTAVIKAVRMFIGR
jgi:hypothetical protein